MKTQVYLDKQLQMRKLDRRCKKLRIVIASLLFAVGCGPTVRDMPVVYFTTSWELGEVKECQTQRDSSALNKYLLCSKADYESALALESPTSGAVIQNPKIFAVSFRGSGHPSLYQNCTDWRCRKTVDGISCN